MVAQTQPQVQKEKKEDPKLKERITKKLVRVIPHACGTVEINEFELVLDGYYREVDRKILSRTIMTFNLIQYDEKSIYIQSDRTARVYTKDKWDYIELEPILCE